MKHLKTTAIHIFLAIFVMSCVQKQELTRSAIEKYKLHNDHLKNTQFYLSEDVTLYKKRGEYLRRTDNGKLIVKNKENLSKIVIKKGTKGVIKKIIKKKIDTVKILVSFDEKSEEDVIVFGYSGSSGDGLYKIMARDWTPHSGIIDIMDQEFFLKRKHADAHLYFKKKEINNKNITTKRLRGNDIKK